MLQVKANESMISVLSPIKEQVEVLDAQGNLMGYFTPISNADDELRKRIFADYASGEYQKRKARSAGGPKFTTEQVLERLRSVETA